MKALILYSGGKDSSLVAYLLDKLDYEVKLITANFGVLPEAVKTAQNSAKVLGFKHEIFTADKSILEKAVDIVEEDGFPLNGINYAHKQVLEEICKQFSSEYKVIADGTRRDDKTPKLSYAEVQSLEARHKIEYFTPLQGFPYGSVNYLTDRVFKIKEIQAGSEPTSEYETEIRFLLNKRGKDSSEIFPKDHIQTIILGWKK